MTALLFLLAIIFTILAIVDYAKDKNPQGNAIRAVLAIIIMIVMTRV